MNRETLIIYTFRSGNVSSTLPPAQNNPLPVDTATSTEEEFSLQEGFKEDEPWRS